MDFFLQEKVLKKPLLRSDYSKEQWFCFLKALKQTKGTIFLSSYNGSQKIFRLTNTHFVIQ